MKINARVLSYNSQSGNTIISPNLRNQYIYASIHRYLSDKQLAANINADDRLKYSRDVLSAKMKELKP